MATTTIHIKPPSWETAFSIYLEVLRTNEWYSEAGQDAREWIYDLARMMDTINKEDLLKKAGKKRLHATRRKEGRKA